MELRPEIEAFAAYMEAAMQGHDPVKGDSWKSKSRTELWLMLIDELYDVLSALHGGNESSLTHECSSLACFAMMICTVKDGED
jgi:hypothetical protein